jgi:hypothetical protein
MVMRIVPNESNNPPGKLADAEHHFDQGPMNGLKLVGFAMWERRTGNGRNVTFPSRGELHRRRRAAYLRPEQVRELIL